jgi:DNA-binding transcriptional MerR regulator
VSLAQNEVAADNQRRRMEELPKSPVGAVIEGAISLAGPALVVGSSLVASSASGTTGLVAAGGVVGGLGIVDWFRKLGTSKVNENLESLGQATEDALKRVENSLLEHGTSIEEIKARIDSQGFRDGMASAALQALRTTQKDRLKRMAFILANGVNDGKLVSESLDDMMRAAAELKDGDIAILENLYKWQNRILNEKGMNPTKWYGDIQSAHQNLVKSGALNPHEHLNYRSSYLRLERLGLIQQITSINNFDGVGYDLYALLMEGKRFYECLQEIAVPQ